MEMTLLRGGGGGGGGGRKIAHGTLGGGWLESCPAGFLQHNSVTLRISCSGTRQLQHFGLRSGQ